MITALTIFFGGCLAYALRDSNPPSKTYAALNELRDKLLDGKSTGTKAAQHLLGDYAKVFKQHPELFKVSEPYALQIVETGEYVWALDLTVYERAKHRNDPHKGYTEAAIYHNTDTKTLKPYIY